MSYFDRNYNFPPSSPPSVLFAIATGLLNPWYLHLAELVDISPEAKSETPADLRLF
jgi:hypothetical protein